uniref:F-box domain-containing protein n=1 Tax=Schizophyllum commune (strain H4-8 / FGSC 9210) TaxID=578458 RepID=D8Q9C9_SCHCM
MSYASAVAGASGDSDRSDPKPASTNSTDKEDHAQACGTDFECHSTENAQLQARHKRLREGRDHYKLLSENTQLTVECQALENEAARYKSLYEFPDATRLLSAPSRPRTITDLPPEIMLFIFERAVAPPFLASPLYTALETPWLTAMSTKCALSLVSRSWHQTAAQVIYRDVGLRSIGQITAFLETLLNARMDLASLLCPPSLVRGIVHLRLSEHLWYWENLMELLATSSHCLETLQLPLADHGIDKYAPSGLVFPALLTLTLISDYDSILRVAAKWGMPRLQNLTLNGFGFNNTAQALQALALQNGHSSRRLLDDDIQAVQFFPRLEHLVLSPNMFGTLAHPALQWIDLWEPQLDKNYAGDTNLLGLPNLSETPLFQEVNTEHCPFLRGMRSLDHGLFHMWDLPRLLKPCAAPPLGEYTAWEYPGVCVKQSANRVWRGDLERVHVDRRIDEESESEGERDEDEDDEDEDSEDEDDEDEDGEDEEDGNGYDEDAEDGAGSDDDVNIGKGANVDEEDAVPFASITRKRSESLLSHSTMDEDDSDEAEAKIDEDETECDDGNDDDGEDADEDDDASTDSDEESSDEDDDSVFYPDSSSYSDSDSVHSSDTEGDVEEQVSDNEEIPQLMHDEALAIFRRWPRLGVD